MPASVMFVKKKTRKKAKGGTRCEVDITSVIIMKSQKVHHESDLLITGTEQVWGETPANYESELMFCPTLLLAPSLPDKE